jgi:hypothetical protein
MELEGLKRRRLQSWCQDGEHRVPDSTAAVDFINRHGLATLYPASTEVPNLYWAYVSEPNAKSEAKWDSPAGEVYGWRWDLGRATSAFYGALVAKKPTWIGWDALPYVLGFAMDRRDPEAQYADGLLSNEAIRIVRAFEGTEGILSTKDLRFRAGFPTGKAERAAYLRGVEELDSRLFLAKTFDVGGEGDDMSHALIRMKYGAQVAEGLSMAPEAALAAFLGRYLPQAIYLDPKPFAKHLRLSPQLMEGALASLITDGLATRFEGLVVTTKQLGE